MAVARGIVTEIGAATSHAAVVTRELGVPCIVCCGEATVTVLEGRVVTLDAGHQRLV
jgi:pyruvate, orthophosphate dikinase